MKLLILSFYYPPDLCAGSFRTASLIKALQSSLPEHSSIEVITTLPNRYSTFSSSAPEVEEHQGLRIHRIALPRHKSGMADQSRAFISYATGVLKLTRGQGYDMVYATSSRLMTAVLGAFVGRRLNVPLYLDIRDIFVDTIRDVISSRLSRLFTPFFSMLESWSIRSAAKVNLVSEGFLPYFQSRYPNQHFSLFTNGIDHEFIQAQPVTQEPARNTVLEVLYAGNIGEGQGLHEIIPELACKFTGRLRFRIIGDGGRRQQLEEAVNRAGCDNVEILAPVKRDALIQAYQAADVLFLHLNDYPAFLKVLPSKLFEYATSGKPIWAGVSGYSADFLRKNVSNVAVFHPCNVNEAIKTFNQLEMITAPRSDFVRRFDRVHIMREMAQDITRSRTEVQCESC